MENFKLNGNKERKTANQNAEDPHILKRNKMRNLKSAICVFIVLCFFFGSIRSISAQDTGKQNTVSQNSTFSLDIIPYDIYDVEYFVDTVKPNRKVRKRLLLTNVKYPSGYTLKEAYSLIKKGKNIKFELQDHFMFVIEHNLEENIKVLKTAIPVNLHHSEDEHWQNKYQMKVDSKTGKIFIIGFESASRMDHYISIYEIGSDEKVKLDNSGFFSLKKVLSKKVRKKKKGYFHYSDLHTCRVKRMDLMMSKNDILISGIRKKEKCQPIYFRYNPEQHKLYKVNLKVENREELKNEMKMAEKEKENNDRK